MGMLWPVTARLLNYLERRLNRQLLDLLWAEGPQVKTCYKNDSFLEHRNANGYTWEFPPVFHKSPIKRRQFFLKIISLETSNGPATTRRTRRTPSLLPSTLYGLSVWVSLSKLCLIRFFSVKYPASPTPSIWTWWHFSPLASWSPWPSPPLLPNWLTLEPPWSHCFLY